MAIGFRKIMVEIQGQFFDLWHLVSAEKEEEWNSVLLRMEYIIVLNKTVVSSNFRDVRFHYDNKDSRDIDLALIRKTLSNSPFILFANDLQEDEELVASKRKKKKATETDDEEDLDLSELD